MKHPIVITLDGDVITHYPECKSDDDQDPIEGRCFGTHLLCNSFVDCKVTSCTMNTLLCRGCHLRVEIPALIATTSELRKHLQELQPPGGWCAPLEL